MTDSTDETPKRPHRRTKPDPTAALRKENEDLKAQLAAQHQQPVQLARPPKPALHPNGTPDRLVEMERSLEQRQGASLLERLEQRAAPVDNPAKAPSGLSYNWPLAWVRRPDGDIVQLQSDPVNRQYYEELGFTYLRPAEVREWLEDVRPAVIAEQKRRAGLITVIRQIAQRVPQYVLDEDQDNPFSLRTTEELEEILADAKEATGLKIRLPRVKPEPVSAPPTDAQMSGVDTADQITMEGLEQKKQRANGRAIEIQPGRGRRFA